MPDAIGSLFILAALETIDVWRGMDDLRRRSTPIA